MTNKTKVITVVLILLVALAGFYWYQQAVSLSLYESSADTAHPFYSARIDNSGTTRVELSITTNTGGVFRRDEQYYFTSNHPAGGDTYWCVGNGDGTATVSCTAPKNQFCESGSTQISISDEHERDTPFVTLDNLGVICPGSDGGGGDDTPDTGTTTYTEESFSMRSGGGCSPFIGSGQLSNKTVQECKDYCNNFNNGDGCVGFTRGPGDVCRPLNSVDTACRSHDQSVTTYVRGTSNGDEQTCQDRQNTEITEGNNYCSLHNNIDCDTSAYHDVSCFSNPDGDTCDADWTSDTAQTYLNSLCTDDDGDGEGEGTVTQCTRETEGTDCSQTQHCDISTETCVEDQCTTQNQTTTCSPTQHCEYNMCVDDNESSPTPTPLPLRCTPNTQDVDTGNIATITARGGSGNYSWTATGGTPSSGNGKKFKVSYDSPGIKIVKLSGGSKTVKCKVVVAALPESPTPTPTEEPTATVTPTPTPTTTTSPSIPPLLRYGLKDGDLITSFNYDGNRDIFIVNQFSYKRLFLNEVIFGFYGHLTGGYQNVKQVVPTIENAFPTSMLYRNCETNDAKVWALDVTGADIGTLHWVNMSGTEAVRQDPDFFKKIFCINDREFKWYTKSSVNYTGLEQVRAY